MFSLNNKSTFISVIELLIILFGINSLCFSQNNSKKMQLILHSSVDTCTYNEDMFKVRVTLKCKGLLPRKVYTNECISENVVGQGVNKGEMFLIVRHEGQVYRYFESVMLFKHGLAKKHLILPLHSVKGSQEFYFKLFHPENEKSRENVSNSNMDFGLYSVTAAFVDKSNDTIYSNPINIWYLE